MLPIQRAPRPDPRASGALPRLLLLLLAAALAAPLRAAKPAPAKASGSAAPAPARADAARPCPSPAGDSSLYTLQSWPPSDSRPAPARDILAGEGVAEGEDALSAYTQVRSAAFAGWAPAGIYVLTRLGLHPQLHRVASPLADRRQETFFRHRVDQWHLNPVPARRQALIAEDRGGDEAFALRLLDLSTGKARPLNCPPGRVSAVVWNDSGTAFAYAHTPKGTDRWDVRMGRPDGRDTLLLGRPGTWMPMDWDPSGARLVLQRYVSSSESELHVLALSGGEVTRVLPQEKPQYFDHAAWVRLPETGRMVGLAFTSDRLGGFHRLWLLAPGDDEPRALSPPVPWDVEWAAAGGDRRTVVYSLNERGASVLHAVRPGVTRPDAARLPGIPRGIIEGVTFHPSGREFGFTVNAAAFPGEAFTYSLKDRRCVRWTESETAGLPREGFREPEHVEYPTFDSVGGKPRLVPAWLYLPDGLRDGKGKAPAAAARKAAPRSDSTKPAAPPGGPGAPGGARVPVLVQIHGGPELQARAGFDPFVQYVAGRMGAAVVLPNVRGSSGYGKDYLKADDGRLRPGAVRDLGALLDWIATRPELDPKRVAVAGRSYGGFMALSALIRYGDRLTGGVSTVGITHFPSFLRETSGYRRDLRRVEYGDERDPAMAAFLDSLSPASHLDRLRLPLLLAHGRNDPRVPYAESRRLFEALKARKVPVRLLTFEQEGHAFRSEASQRVHYRAMAGFLAERFGLPPPP